MSNFTFLMVDILLSWWYSSTHILSDKITSKPQCRLRSRKVKFLKRNKEYGFNLKILAQVGHHHTNITPIHFNKEIPIRGNANMVFKLLTLHVLGLLQHVSCCDAQVLCGGPHSRDGLGTTVEQSQRVNVQSLWYIQWNCRSGPWERQLRLLPHTIRKDCDLR